MNIFGKGVAIILGASIVFYVIRYAMPYLVTSTSFSDNIMTYLVPLGVFVGMIVAVWMVAFKRKRQ